MATDLDKTEAAILIGAALAVAYFLYKSGTVVSNVVNSAATAVQNAAATVNANVGPPVGDDPSTACNGGPCPDDILARQPWYQSALHFFGVNTDEAGQPPTQPPLPEGAQSP